jgi:DNA-binding transcriptional MerR regulator
MARKTKADEIDDLVDDLDELEDDEEIEDEVEVEDDEDEDFDEEDEDDEDPDEAPKARKGRSKSKAKPKKVREGIGTKEVAEAAGITSRSLRMYLRAKGYQPRDDREGRYNWSSLNHPEVKQILKEIKAGAADKENKAKLAALKEKKAATKAPAKKATTTKRTRRAKADADA